MAKKIFLGMAGLLLIMLAVFAIQASVNPTTIAIITQTDDNPSPIHTPTATYSAYPSRTLPPNLEEQAEEFLRNHDPELEAYLMDKRSRALNTAEYIGSMLFEDRWQPIPIFFSGMYFSCEGALIVLIYEAQAQTDKAIEFLSRVENVGGAIVRYVEFPLQYLHDLNDKISSALYALKPDHPLSYSVKDWYIFFSINRLAIQLVYYDEEVIALFRDEISDSPAIKFQI